tara:strand:+ start:7776 stop:8168 length:393 start_codon:yes stop_codon:yes gene_type:complete
LATTIIKGGRAIEELFRLIFTLLLSVIFSNAQETENGKTITVTIEKISNHNGKVLLSLHTKDAFMKAPGIQNKESKIVDAKVEVTFENENQRMDFEANGMPKESYGTSNNDMGFGPPQYETAKFDVRQKI